MSDLRVNQAARILDLLVEKATTSMPPYNAMVRTDPKRDEVHQRWIAERNLRVEWLLKLYTANDISGSLDSIGNDLAKHLSEIASQIEYMRGT